MMMTRGLQFPNKAKPCVIILRASLKHSAEKCHLCFLRVQTSIYACKTPAGPGVLQEARAALHRLSWLLWGVLLQPQHKKPIELTPPSPQPPCSLSGGGGERLDIWQGVVWAPRDSKVTPISGDPHASPHQPKLRRPRGYTRPCRGKQYQQANAA